MRAGEMDERITFFKDTEAADSFGQTTITYLEGPTVWADVRGLKAQERFLAEGEHTTRAKAFFVRYRSDVQDTWRIRHRGIYYRITGIREAGERRESLEIAAENIEKVTDANITEISQ